MKSGDMHVPRAPGAALLMPDGKVLVIGGFTNNPDGSCCQETNSVEIYNPNTETFSLMPSMSKTLPIRDAFLLKNGQVIIVSENDNPRARYSALYKYNPSTGEVQKCKDMLVKRDSQATIMLPDEKILITGGIKFGSAKFTRLREAELFDPSTENYTQVGDMVQSMYSHSVVLLKNNKVLILSDNGSSELYDIKTKSFLNSGVMQQPRSEYTYTLLPNGNVLIVGGNYNIASLRDVEIYNSKTNKFELTGFLNTERSRAKATLLKDGNVLVTGGFTHKGYHPHNLKSAEIYDVKKGKFFNVGSMTIGRGTSYGQIKLKNGKIFIIGSGDMKSLTSTELFQDYE